MNEAKKFSRLTHANRREERTVGQKFQITLGMGNSTGSMQTTLRWAGLRKTQPCGSTTSNRAQKLSRITKMDLRIDMPEGTPIKLLMITSIAEFGHQKEFSTKIPSRSNCTLAGTLCLSIRSGTTWITRPACRETAITRIATTQEKTSQRIA